MRISKYTVQKSDLTIGLMLAMFLVTLVAANSSFARTINDLESLEMDSSWRQVDAVQPVIVNSKQLQDATEFFKNHVEPVAVKQTGQQLWLANRQIGIEIIQGETGFYLSRIYGIASGQDFLPAYSGKTPPKLWKLKLRLGNGRNKNGIVVTNLGGGQLSTSIDSKESEIMLNLSWKGISILDQPEVLDVTVTVTIRQGDPLSRWRIDVTNRSIKYGLWEVIFPILELVPIGQGSSTNNFTIPRVRGIVANDPFNRPKGFGVNSHEGNLWPGTLNMQFHALYDDSGTGLYLAAYDGQGYRKKFYADKIADRQVMIYKVGHYPTNMGYPAENYQMNYDMCLGPFVGDWYDACQIYRRWALQQRWCQYGPLRIRKNIPKWYKQTPLVLKTQTPHGNDDVNMMRDWMLKVLNFIGMKMPIDWYIWQEFFPEMSMSSTPGCAEKVPEAVPHHDTNVHNATYPFMPALDAFSAACKQLFEAGGCAKAFVRVKLYDPGLDENGPFVKQARPNVLRNVDGRSIWAWHDSTWAMCYHTSWWQQRLKGEILALMENENVHGIYLDTFYGGYYHCFDTRHGHSHGGGNTFYNSARKVSQVLWQGMKAKDPQAIMTGENPSEVAIDLLDGFLLYWPVWADMAPLLATVYGDYICRSSAFLVPESDGFYVQAAAMFTEGGQMGRLRFQANYADWMKDFDAGSPYTQKMKFLKKLCHYWKAQAGGRFLAYGQLLRPIQFTGSDPMPIFSYNEPSRYIHGYMDGLITAPALMNGVFKTHDGDLGVFIVNITDKPVKCSLELIPDRYPISESASYSVTPIDEAGKRGKNSVQKGKISYTGTIAAYDVLFLEAKEHKTR